MIQGIFCWRFRVAFFLCVCLLILRSSTMWWRWPCERTTDFFCGWPPLLQPSQRWLLSSTCGLGEEQPRAPHTPTRSTSSLTRDQAVQRVWNSRRVSPALTGRAGCHTCQGMGRRRWSPGPCRSHLTLMGAPVNKQSQYQSEVEYFSLSWNWCLTRYSKSIN